MAEVGVDEVDVDELEVEEVDVVDVKLRDRKAAGKVNFFKLWLKSPHIVQALVEIVSEALGPRD